MIDACIINTVNPWRETTLKRLRVGVLHSIVMVQLFTDGGSTISLGH